MLVVLGTFSAITFEELYQGVYAIPGKTDSQGRGVPGEGLLHQLPVPQRSRLPVHCKKSGLLPSWGRPMTWVAPRDRKPVSDSLLHYEGRRPRLSGHQRSRPVQAGLPGGGVEAPSGRPWRRPWCCCPATGGWTLLRPFCGSGICIEAALIAKNRAPGLNRSFAAQKWDTVPARHWMDAVDEAISGGLDRTYDIWGGDLDPRAIEIAWSNAAKAEVEDTVRFEVYDARRFKYRSLRPGGHQPAYGERLMEKEEVSQLYGASDTQCACCLRVAGLGPVHHTEFEQVFGARARKETQTL